jgi:PhnB protein
MKSIHSYLTFNGNCREAMTFYKKCLGGKLSFQTIGESPLSQKMPAKMKNCILQAVLTHKDFVLMGSDMVSESGLLKGNSVSMVLNCSSEKEIRECYKNLSRGGEPTHPLEITFWNALFGGLKDKYGNTWILNYKNDEKKL